MGKGKKQNPKSSQLINTRAGYPVNPEFYFLNYFSDFIKSLLHFRNLVRVKVCYWQMHVHRTNCLGCGKPLKKRLSIGRYYCENESCNVVFVKYPNKPDITEKFFKPSKSKKKLLC